MAYHEPKPGWECFWTSHLGCILGCLRYLGSGISKSRLAGLTGHAFVLNVHKIVCPSGPTAWNTDRFFELGRNAGFETRRVVGFRKAPGFKKAQADARALIESAFQEDTPCYAWELYLPEYYVIRDVTPEGCFYHGPQAAPGSGPKPWDTFGMDDTGVIEVHALRRIEPAEEREAVLEALAFAVEFARRPEPWIFPDYTGGLRGYEVWIDAMKKGDFDPFGISYTPRVWQECRELAAEFLRDVADDVLPEAGEALHLAADRYDRTAKALETIAGMYPFPPPDARGRPDESKINRTIRYLEKAYESEVEAIGYLTSVISE